MTGEHRHFWDVFKTSENTERMFFLLPVHSHRSDVPLGHPWLPSAGTGNGNSGHGQF